MAKVVGVRFRNVGKIYYFDPKDFDIEVNDHVIVETARGMEYGRVVLGPKEVKDKEVVHPLKEVIRPSTPEDDEREDQNRQKEREAFKVCKQKIREHQLDMKLIDAEYTFDNNKVLFYFTADGRVDFRLLVKDLASIFKTRIELRQIGVRDETKILGGIGICGRSLCCHSYLSDFAPVSIKMAKEQNLSLNQTKISGVCGRLMCCLKNEQETYEELNKKLPSLGDFVTVPDGRQGTVHSVNVLRQLVKVVIEENDQKEITEYPVDDLEFRPRKKKGKGQNQEQDRKENREPKEKEKDKEKDKDKDKEPKGSGEKKKSGEKKGDFKKHDREPGSKKRANR
ncbi:MAG: stage 0 sporulation family protein [Blautia sp.]|nr:stage 0 sporulation family protein [Blautia sp.]